MQPIYRLAKLATPKNLGALVIVLALLAIIPIGLRLNQQSQSTQSQAAPDSVKVAGTSLALVHHKFDCDIADPENGIRPSEDCNVLKESRIFAVDLLVNSDLDASNLVKTQLNFDPSKLVVTKIVTKGESEDENFFVKSWISNNFNNDKGTISLVGSVPDPGFKTVENKPAIMARVYLKVKAGGSTTIYFDKSSSIYRSADNQNILNSTENLNLEIK